MKGKNMKTVTINVTGASQSQWSTFLLELNLMKKAWKPYGVDVKLKAHSINKIIEKVTSIHDPRTTRQASKRVQQNQTSNKNLEHLKIVCFKIWRFSRPQFQHKP